MRRSDFDRLVPSLACPNCYGDLLPDDINDGDEVMSGRLRCAGCTASYPINESVLFLIVPDSSWKSVLQEAVSWKSYETEQDFLKKTKRVPPCISKAEQYDLERGIESQARFEDIFSTMEINKGIKACEVAAFKCQQARYLVRKGANVVATDAWVEPLIYGPGGEGECRLIPKICCNAERLPFKSNSFDLTYVRTSIHHFKRPVRAIREMGRITRPGGKVVIINEPSNYLFGRSMSEKVLSTDPVFIIGMNENIPCFLTYLFSLFIAGLRNPVFYYYGPSFSTFITKVLSVLGVNPDRIIGSIYCGKTTLGLKLLKLIFVYCDISLIAEKKAVSIQHRKPVPKKRFCFAIEQFLDRGLQNMTDLWRGTLELKDAERFLLVGENDLYHLRRGWGKAENFFGYKTRWTRYIAYAFLRRKAGDDVLKIGCQAPINKLGRIVRAEVSIDGGEWRLFSLESDDPVHLCFPIQEGAADIVEVRIRTPEPWRGSDVYPGKYDDSLFFDVAVRYIGIGKYEEC